MPVHPNSIKAIQKYQVKKWEVRNPHGWPGRWGLSVSKVREIAKMKSRETGESISTEVSKFLFRVVVEGRVIRAGGALGPVEDAGADSPESLAWGLFSRAAVLVPVAVEERAGEYADTDSGRRVLRPTGRFE